MHAKKPTRFMTNCPSISKELQRRCDGGHSHQPLVGGRAAWAARYPPELCRAICVGLIDAIEEDRWKVKSLCRVSTYTSTQDQLKKDAEAWHDREGGQGVEWQKAWDDVTGDMLDPRKVQDARREEIQYTESMNVWKKMTREEAKRRGWEIIATRWIDVNKGDQDNPLYRSRLVGKEFNDGGGEGLFASTPPLEALRMLVSDAATTRQVGKGADDQ